MSQTSTLEKRPAAVGPRNVAHRTKDRRDITGGEIMKMVSLRLPRDLVVELKRLAEDRHWGYQALARSALDDYVKKSAPHETAGST